MNFDDFAAAAESARVTLRYADRMVEKLGWMMCGRLHTLDAHTLRELKRELRNFDMTTGRWKP